MNTTRVNAVSGVHKRTALIEAAHNGNVDCTRLLLNHERTDVLVKDDDGQTALTQAKGDCKEFIQSYLFEKTQAEKSLFRLLFKIKY